MDDYGAIEGKLIEDLMSSNPIIIGVRLRVTTDNCNLCASVVCCYLFSALQNIF